MENTFYMMLEFKSACKQQDQVESLRVAFNEVQQVHHEALKHYINENFEYNYKNLINAE